MPVNKSAFFRYLLIDRCLSRKNNNYHSKEELISYIEENIDDRISDRTLMSDLKEMKESNVLGFYAPIKYSKLNNGYYYSEKDYSIGRFIKLNDEDYESLELAMNILDVYKDVPALANFKFTVEKIHSEIKIKKVINNEEYEKFIFPEHASHIEGLEFLQEIAVAVKNKNALKITYSRFLNNKSVIHIIHPYCLKEYNERWYVIGWSNLSKGILHLALDRINHVKIEENVNYYDIDFNPDEYFKNYFGVTVNQNAEPEKIIVSFNKLKGQYLKTRHIHKSQKLIKEDKHETVFQFYLVPNYEFISFILGCAFECKIIEPLSLKMIIIEKLNEALKNNSNKI